MINIVIGFLSGIISGMGIGGGAILIPALTLFQNISQQLAQGINLTYFIPTAIAALFVHIKNKSIRIKSALILGVSGLPGAVLGAIFAGIIKDSILRKLFGGFLFLVGIYEIFKGFKEKSC